MLNQPSTTETVVVYKRSWNYSYTAIYLHYRSKFVDAKVSEGFNEIVKIDFIPYFTSEDQENLYKQFLLEKWLQLQSFWVMSYKYRFVHLKIWSMVILYQQQEFLLLLYLATLRPLSPWRVCSSVGYNAHIDDWSFTRNSKR